MMVGELVGHMQQPRGLARARRGMGDAVGREVEVEGCEVHGVTWISVMVVLDPTMTEGTQRAR